MSQPRRRRQRQRTWTLGTLDRHREYVLFFHQGTYAWEVMEVDSRRSELVLSDPELVVTKPDVAERRAQRRNGRARSARGLSQGHAPAEDASERGPAPGQAKAAS